MAKLFECELDGVVIRGDTDDELWENVQAHLRQAHPDLVGQLTREQVLAGAREA